MVDEEEIEEESPRSDRLMKRPLAQAEVSFIDSTSNRLPAPYFTKCKNVPGFKTLGDCALFLVDSSVIKYFDRMILFGMIFDPNLEYKLLSKLYFLNETFMIEFGNMIKDINPNITEYHISWAA